LGGSWRRSIVAATKACHEIQTADFTNFHRLANLASGLIYLFIVLWVYRRLMVHIARVHQTTQEHKND